MNNDISSRLSERKHGIVTNFAGFPGSLLLSMKNDVGLEMTVGFLEQLQQHYRNVEHRDPSLDELYFIDRMLTLAGAAGCAVNELLTDSPAVAETYADMMSKYNASSRDSRVPLIGQLAGTAGRYLERIGKKTSLNGKAAIAAGAYSSPQIALSGHTPICRTQNGAAGIAFRTQAVSAPAGSILVIISRWGATTDSEFYDSAANLLTSREGRAVIAGRVVGQRGIASAVCAFCKGAFVDLSVLPGISRPYELTELCDAAHGAIIAALPADAVNALLRAAYEKKMYSAVLGNVTSDSRLTVRHEYYTPVSLEMNFIRGLSHREDGQAIIRDQYRGTPSAGSVANQRDCNADARLSMASARSADVSDPFFASLDATLTAIAGCVAGGASYDDIGISFDMELPCSSSAPASRGDALALVLGAYRAQIEFCIPDKNSRLSLSDDDRFRFTAAAAALTDEKARMVPASFTAAGSLVYILTPLIASDGMPDFEDLRRLWSYVNALCRDGTVLSAFAIGSDGAAAAIDAMCNSAVVFSKSADCPDVLLGKPAPGGIVIETNVRIQGALAGITENNTTKSDADIEALAENINVSADTGNASLSPGAAMPDADGTANGTETAAVDIAEVSGNVIAL